MAHMSASKHVLDDFADMLKEVANVEKAPKVEGRSMAMFLALEKINSAAFMPQGSS